MRSVWRIVKCLLTNSSEMRVYGAHWQTWHLGPWANLLVRQRNGPKHWQTLSTFDLIHSSHLWIQTIFSFGKHSTAMQNGTVSRLWFCRRCRRLNINIKWTVVHDQKSHVRANKLDVLETDFSFTQLNRSCNYFSWCRFTHGWIPALDLWDSVFEVFHSSPNQMKKTKGQVRGDLSRNTTSNKHIQNKTKVPIHHNSLELSNVDHVSSNAKSSRFGAMLKAEVQHWDTYPESTESLLTGCLTELIWIPRFKSSISTPNTNLQTYWPKGTSHVMCGTIFFICSTSAISA